MSIERFLHVTSICQFAVSGKKDDNFLSDRTWHVPMQRWSMGQWTVWRGWGWPLRSTIFFMPSMLGRKSTHTHTHTDLTLTHWSVAISDDSYSCSLLSTGMQWWWSWLVSWLINWETAVSWRIPYLWINVSMYDVWWLMVNWFFFPHLCSWSISLFLSLCFGLIAVCTGLPLQRNSLSAATNAHRPTAVWVRQWISDQ